MKACPTTEQLQTWMRGELQSEESAGIVEHLETCLVCQGEMDNWDSSINWHSALSQQEAVSGEESHFMMEALYDRWTKAVQQEFPRAQAEEPDSGQQMQIGDYRLLQQIGQGGMGVVFKARHTL